MRRTLLPLLMAASLLAVPSAPFAPSAAADDGAGAPLAVLPHQTLPLEGTPWRLSGYRWKGTPRQPGPEVAATMTLTAGKLDASGGCTPFGGSYGSVGSTIDFVLKRLKDNDCGEQTTIVQLGMIDGLRKAASYSIDSALDGIGDELVLFSASDNEMLRFRLDDIGALDVAEWRVEAYTIAGERTPAAADQAAVMSFRPARSNDAQRTSAGRLDASSGCNAIIAEYFQHADIMSFGKLERTDAPCLPEVAAQEAAMVSVLDATALRLELAPDRLVLASSDTGDTLELASTQPLEGSTWVLAKFPIGGQPTGTVALWFNDGAASGEGPCGAISAGYATDGYFISFAGVAGAGDENCAAAAAEKALLAALRSAVMLDRDQPQLRMRDARGSIVLRLKAPRGP